ncbi:Rep [uncultured virus]|uniref:ATP-dependent helicase Rep n=1 Tax=uncultured virus TaxID=340016 RepID=A0A2K9LSX5_9VIRU|nr:Rep [uncultured virus]
MGSRAFCITINNPESNELPIFPGERYVIWQLEKGKNGITHIQGYIELSSPQRISAIKAIIPRAHIEVRGGTREKARDYCRKEDTRIEGPFERGNFGAGGAGRRNDLIEIKSKIDEGKDELSISQEHFETWSRNYKAFREYKKLITPKRRVKPRVIVLWGESGTGKTTRCINEGGEDAYWKDPDEWWDGYEGQKTIVLDDFYGWLKYSVMLRLLDRTPLNVGFKGGKAAMVAETIFITSNDNPRDWYPNVPNKKALLRRIDEEVRYPINPTLTLTSGASAVGLAALALN